MNLLKSITIISMMTFFSKIFGFVRDIFIAKIFGAGTFMDSFLIAFKLPNLLRRIFAEGAFSQAFVPILIEYKNKENKEKCFFISNIFGLLFLTLLILTFIGMLSASWVILIIAPGFSNNYEKIVLATTILRITFPYIFLISISTFFGTILNTWNYFFIPSLSPILLNISMLSCSFLAESFFDPPILSLAWSVLLGGVLQLIYQIPILKKIGIIIFPKFKFYNVDVIRVIKLMIPIIFIVSINQISLITNTIFSSFLASGAISWMYYADRLMEFPCGILGSAFNAILLPLLSHNAFKKKFKEYSQLLDKSLRLCLLLALPSSVALGMLAYPLIVTLFQYGKFSQFDSFMTYKILVVNSLGLTGLILTKILMSAFYSHKNTTTPMRISILILIITQIMNLIFIGPLKQTGLALSTGLAACLNAYLLYWQLKKKNYFNYNQVGIIFYGNCSYQ